MATDTKTSLIAEGDWVPPDLTARRRVDAWSRQSKEGDPKHLPPLGQPGFGRTCKQVFNLHVGMLDRNHPHGPLTGEHGFGPTQASIATLAGVCVRSVKLAEQWLSNPMTVRVAHVVKQRGNPAIMVEVLRDEPADPRGRPGPRGTRVPWTKADGLRKWPAFIQVFKAEKVSGGGGGRRRRICVHPLFYSAPPKAFKACRELPDWPEIDITAYDIGMPEMHGQTRDELMEMFHSDNKLGPKNGELSSPFQTDHYLGETDE